jgi:hypothetical protein
MHISEKDKNILRRLAGQVAEFSNDPRQDKKRALWVRHNKIDQERPLVVTDTEPAMWTEVCPSDQYECEGEFARHHEEELRKLIHWHSLGDDRPFDPVYFLPMTIHNTGWGVAAHTVGSGNEDTQGSLHFEPVIVEENDIEKIKEPTVTVDREATAREHEVLDAAFGDLLPIHDRGYFVPWFAPIDLFIEWRGIENMYMDMMIQPDWFKAAMEKITNGYLGMLRQFKEQDGLSRNDISHFVGSGGCGYTDELPQDDFDSTVRPMDMWGQATTQIFSEVSAEMHMEFALAYDRQWLENFGLNCYGCCEPLHFKMDIMRTLPRLRRVSMSPKADWAAGAEAVRRDFIFSAKPNPAVFAATKWDPELVRKNARKMLERTKGCNVEFIMKDTMTCRNEPHRIADWTRIMREECENSVS